MLNSNLIPGSAAGGWGTTSIPIYMHRLLVFSVSQGGPVPYIFGKRREEATCGLPAPHGSTLVELAPILGKGK